MVHASAYWHPIVGVVLALTLGGPTRADDTTPASSDGASEDGVPYSGQLSADDDGASPAAASPTEPEAAPETASKATDPSSAEPEAGTALPGEEEGAENAAEPAAAGSAAEEASVEVDANGNSARSDANVGGTRNADEPPKMGAPTLIANGEERVIVKDGDFSMVPPKTWEVFSEMPGLTLLLQVPHSSGQRYQRTIQVASFSGSRFIDDVTAREFEETIVRKFASASASIEDYRVRNHMEVEMADGRTALLFYSEFNFDTVPLMQMHILLSSRERHYLVSYTDLAEHFEKEDNEFLAEAWAAMTSTQLGSRTPLRHEMLIIMGLVAVLIALVAGGALAARSYWSSKRYARYAEGKDLEDVHLTDDDHIPISITQLELSEANRAKIAEATAAVVSKHDKDDDKDGPDQGNDMAV